MAHSKDPRDRSNGPGAWPTEWSVDVDEPRDQPPEQGSRRTPIAAATARLAPPQEAWQKFVRHVTRTCDRCRDIDVPNCAEAERLHRTWQTADAEARRQLNSDAR